MPKVFCFVFPLFYIYSKQTNLQTVRLVHSLNHECGLHQTHSAFKLLVLTEKQQQKYCDKEQWQFSVYIISITSEDRAYSVPVASVLTEQGSEQALVAGLMALREKHPHFYPR